MYRTKTLAAKQNFSGYERWEIRRKITGKWTMFVEIHERVVFFHNTNYPVYIGKHNLFDVFEFGLIDKRVQKWIR